MISEEDLTKLDGDALNHMLFSSSILKGENLFELKILLEAGADPRVDQAKSTTLHLAAAFGNRAVVDMLLAVGGEELLRMEDINGDTASADASRREFEELAIYLDNLCANPSLIPTMETLGIDRDKVELNRALLAARLQSGEGKAEAVGPENPTEPKITS